jgi:hypothetical protein
MMVTEAACYDKEMCLRMVPTHQRTIEKSVRINNASIPRGWGGSTAPEVLLLPGALPEQASTIGGKK